MRARWLTGGVVLLLAGGALIFVLADVGEGPESGASTITAQASTSTQASGQSSTEPPPASSSSSVAQEPTTSTAPSTTQEPTTSLPPADPDAGRDQEMPVPFRQSIEFGRWQIAVSAVDLDATNTILEYVPFNEPPADGHQFVLIELSGVNQSGGIAEPVFDWSLVDEGFSHVPGQIECGEVPDSIFDVRPVENSGQFVGNICFDVESTRVEEGLLLRLKLVNGAASERFFALQ